MCGGTVRDAIRSKARKCYADQRAAAVAVFDYFENRHGGARVRAARDPIIQMRSLTLRTPDQRKISRVARRQRTKDATVQVGSLCFFCGLLLLENSSVKSALPRSWDRSTQMPLVRYYSALFQDQLQAPYIGDVLERIGGDHNQVGELACLHRA